MNTNTQALLVQLLQTLVSDQSPAALKTKYQDMAKRKLPAVRKASKYIRKSTPQARRMARYSAIAAGFERKGLKINFDQNTGRFDNVKSYRLWLAEGRCVRRGEHGVRGLFHMSQTELLPVTKPVDVVNPQVGKAA